ncbi:hypothetical protein BCR42DRAFT_454079 [Absidia repens]|uniref:Uncharacterized protein n=1 Tax=Absidia repens TaxID=90262 RepID=A0A1X2I8K3_9FUNG|nr:hypothetical protein BCR42DRAFT_454079 [Absidia repens]
MKFSIVAALIALSAASVSAADETFSGTIYVYANNLEHPKTTFVKRGSGTSVVTNGIACNGNQTLPGRDYSLAGTFTTVKNQWDFNGQHDNEIAMGYVKVGKQFCLSLTKDSPLSLEQCPPANEEIKAGSKFAWFHDKRGSSIWAYGGDANAEENNGFVFETTDLQTTDKPLTGKVSSDNPDVNAFLSLGHVNMGNTGKPPKGCQ